MTTAAPSPGRPNWTTGALYNFLMEIFPTHHTRSGILDVKRLTRDLERSHEAIYKWLRKPDDGSKGPPLTPANARAICSLANTPENVAALAETDRQPPELRDFDRFVYVDFD